jgi:4-amino-4-deoxy-L-arabinose transferase-like glycosyltransferase
MTLVVAAAALALGLAARAGIFGLPHAEGDERIYAALLEQVRAGKGYTLAGHPILTQDWMVAEQYDTPLFYHPPGGLAWFALFTTLFGARGWELAQLAAFAVFFAATFALARESLPAFPPTTAIAVALLAAFTPIAAHVSMHFWLDGPQVAAVAACAWLTVRAARTNSGAAAAAAGAMLGVAMLVKLNAAIAVPGIAILAWVAAPETTPRRKFRVFGIGAGVAAVFVAPWLLAEVRAFRTLFPAWAGKPSSRLVAENPFVHQVTAVRTPWVYLRLLPRTVWTLVPSLAVLAASRPSGRGGRVAGALVFWIVVVTAANIALGAAGYSKLLRYVVLITPATVALAGWAASESTRMIVQSPRGTAHRAAAIALAGLLAAGIGLEIAHGVQTMRVYPDRAWIRPLFGEPR